MASGGPEAIVLAPSRWLPVIPAASARTDEPPGEPQDEQHRGKDEQPFHDEPQPEQDRNEQQQQQYHVGSSLIGRRPRLLGHLRGYPEIRRPNRMRDPPATISAPRMPSEMKTS